MAAVLDARFAPDPSRGLPNRSVLLVFNATGEDATFTLPVVAGHPASGRCGSTPARATSPKEQAPSYAPAGRHCSAPHSMALLTQVPEE